jgi:hypothetical protein
MNNTYGTLEDGRVQILLTRKNGNPQEAVVIDAEDLPRLLAFKGHFYPFTHQKTGKVYARGYYKDPETGKVQQPLLHRLIADPSKGQNTAHVNGNTLDCTRENLRNLSIGKNIEDVLREEKTFTDGLKEVKRSGDIAAEKELEELATVDPDTLNDKLDKLKDQGRVEKGVSFHKLKRRWEVSAFHKGKRHRLGYWPPEELRKANEAVLFFRREGPRAFNAAYERG